MEVVIYITTFIIGTLLGSFFSLAIYRIPLKQDITHKRSYCPKCNHRLEFLDMIPILSYIFLGGKCRYCKEKIRPRYLLLEVFSGLLFLLFALSLKINLYAIELNKLAYLIFGIFYISTLFIIGGIEKENHQISKPVLFFGLIAETIYIIYLCVLKANMYKYVIYLFVIFVLILLNTALKKQNQYDSYTIRILSLYLYLVIGSGEKIAVFSLIVMLLITAIKIFIDNLKNNKKENKINLGFYLCFANIITLITCNFLLK